MSYEDCHENAQYEVAKMVTRPRLVPLRLLAPPVTGNFSFASEFKWHRHSCLCAVAKPRTRRIANAPASLSAKIPWPPWRLIANLELKLRLTHRKISLLRISNRKKTRVLRAPRRITILESATRSSSRHRTLWHRHSCLCTVAKPRTRRMANAAASLSSGIRIVNRHSISNRDTAIRISPNPYHYSEFEISNRDKMRVLYPPSGMGFCTSAKSRLSQATPYSEFLPQIDHAGPRAYTGPSAEGESSWKIPSY
jgi:hypothetical protein